MQILNDASIEFLEQYLNNASPTGYESGGQKIWMDYLRPFVDTFITDTYGTAVGVINPDAPYKVVIEGHSDEISWYVNYISDDGLIYVIRNGGSDIKLLLQMGQYPYFKDCKGVFGWPPFILENQEKKRPKTGQYFYDIKKMQRGRSSWCSCRLRNYLSRFSHSQ